MILVYVCIWCASLAIYADIILLRFYICLFACFLCISTLHRVQNRRCILSIALNANYRHLNCWFMTIACTYACANKNIITQSNRSIQHAKSLKWQNLCAVSESWLHAIFYTAHGHPVKILNHACISSILFDRSLPNECKTPIARSIHFSAFKSIKHAICTQLSFRNFHVTNFKLRWNWINCDTQYERLKKVFLQIKHKFFQNKLAHLSSFYRTSMCNKLSCDRNPFSNPPKKKRFCLEQCTLAFYFSCNKNHHIVSHEHKHTNTD